ncbi:MAG TPA: hypothetical protein VMZ52_08205 [Bryobacteraceae bacterium]|nr:hypothetical protein [Bryobacteraceae bacterium]
MRLNLDTLKTEIERYLKDNGFLIFQGYSRRYQNQPQTVWNTAKNQDYKAFLNVAKGLGAKVIVLYDHQFSTEPIEENIESIASAGLEFDEQRAYEKRLRDLTVYDGFTCTIELSFQHERSIYVFDLQTEWYTEFMEILGELDESEEDQEDDEDPLGGYYSKN